MKRKLAIFTLLLFCTLLLGGNIPAATQEQETIKLNLSQAVERALTSNLEFQKAGYTWQNAEIEAKKEQAENLLTQSTLLKRQVELSLLEKQEQYQQGKEDLIRQVVDEYLQLKLAQKDLQLKEKELELEKNLLEKVKTQVKGGHKAEIDLLEQNTEYYDALFSLESAKLEYQKSLGNFRITLGLKANSQVELAALVTPDFPEIELEEAWQKGKQNSVALQMSSLKIEVATRELEKNKVSDIPEVDLKVLENNLALAQLEYQITQQNLDYQIQSEWQNYVQSKNDILSNQNSLNQIKANQTIISDQVQAGLASEDQELSAIIGVLEAEYRLASSVRNYYKARLNLLSLIGDLSEGEV